MDDRGFRSRSLGWAWTGSCQDWDNELFVISWHHMALISCTCVGTSYLSFAGWLPTSSRWNTVCGNVWFYLIPLLDIVRDPNDTIRIYTFASLKFKVWTYDQIWGHLKEMDSARTRRVTEVQFCCRTHSFSSLASLVLHFYMKPAHVDITNCMAH